MTFRPADRPPARDERVGRAEPLARDDLVLDDLVFDDVPRPGRWFARLVVWVEVRFRAVVAFVDRDPVDRVPVDRAVVVRFLVVEPERERLDEPPFVRRREWGTVEVIG